MPKVFGDKMFPISVNIYNESCPSEKGGAHVNSYLACYSTICFFVSMSLTMFHLDAVFMNHPIVGFITVFPFFSAYYFAVVVSEVIYACRRRPKNRSKFIVSKNNELDRLEKVARCLYVFVRNSCVLIITGAKITGSIYLFIVVTGIFLKTIALVHASLVCFTVGFYILILLEENE